MNKEKYLEMRNSLLNEVETLIGESKVDESNAKMQEIKDLDNKWEQTKLANANLNALKDNSKVNDLENKSLNPEGVKTVENIKENAPLSNEKIYEQAWANVMMGKKLDNKQQEVFDKVNNEFNNAYTHDTGNTSILIPETVAAGIWSRAEEMYPLYADARKYNVQGKLVLKKHTGIVAGDAAWYEEDTPTADEQNAFGELILDGCELSKAITVTWKLKAMAMSEFIPYIINELGERCGVALGHAAATGKGPTATPPEPQGVETALLAESGRPQVITFTAGALSYANLTAAIAKIHSSYLSGSAIYANNATIWGALANMMDETGRPLFIPDVTSGGVGRMFGIVVKPDAGVSEGNIIIGNADKGLIFNVNEPLSIVTEDHAKPRTTDYVAYAVVDGGVVDTRAFALLHEGAIA